MADDLVYRRFAPPDDARAIIDHLWVVRQPAGTSVREVLLPDGHGLVLVTTGEPGSRVDPLTGVRGADVAGVRGLATRALVREQAGPSVRLGAQLDPLALARLDVRTRAADRSEPLALLVDDAVVARIVGDLDAGRDEVAARSLARAILERRKPGDDDPSLALLGPVVRHVATERGLVTTAELARRADQALMTLHRWFSEHTGVDPARYLAAVRFSAFVREAVGPGPVRPQDVLAAIRWYAGAGYPPREVERFTGLAPLALRAVERGIADALGVPA
jgi:hypothetical protein